MTVKPQNSRVAIVTGGAGGIGKAISLKLVEAGLRIAIIGRNERKGKETVKSIIEHGGEADFFQADLGLDIDIKQAVDNILEKFNRVDVLVNNAAISGYMGAVTDTPLKELETTLKVNLVSIFYLSQLVLPKMIENKYGRIINISSVAYRKAPPNSATYNISKAGLNTLTKTLSKEVASYGITVNAVAPGLVLTDRIIQSRLPGLAQKSGITPEEMLLRLAGDTDTGRLTKAEDVAELVMFLASNASQNITGEIINVAGGS